MPNTGSSGGARNILLGVRITRGRLDDGGLVVREMVVAESILAVALLGTAAVLHGHRGEEPEEGVLEDGGKLFILLLDAVLEAAKDYDAGLGTVGGEVLVALECRDAHGRYGFGDALGKATNVVILM